MYMTIVTIKWDILKCISRSIHLKIHSASLRVNLLHSRAKLIVINLILSKSNFTLRAEIYFRFLFALLKMHIIRKINNSYMFSVNV